MELSLNIRIDDPNIQEILGRPNFSCGKIANKLRSAGHDIDQTSEAEQAHVIYWLLKKYSEHGEAWREEANKELREIKY